MEMEKCVVCSQSGKYQHKHNKGFFRRWHHPHSVRKFASCITWTVLSQKAAKHQYESLLTVVLSSSVSVECILSSLSKLISNIWTKETFLSVFSGKLNQINSNLIFCTENIFLIFFYFPSVSLFPHSPPVLQIICLTICVPRASLQPGRMRSDLKFWSTVTMEERVTQPSDSLACRQIGSQYLSSLLNIWPSLVGGVKKKQGLFACLWFCEWEESIPWTAGDTRVTAAFKANSTLPETTCFVQVSTVLSNFFFFNLFMKQAVSNSFLNFSCFLQEGKKLKVAFII